MSEHHITTFAYSGFSAQRLIDAAVKEGWRIIVEPVCPCEEDIPSITTEDGDAVIITHHVHLFGQVENQEQLERFAKNAGVTYHPPQNTYRSMFGVR